MYDSLKNSIKSIATPEPKAQPMNLLKNPLAYNFISTVWFSSPKPISKGWNLLAQAGFEFAERQLDF